MLARPGVRGHLPASFYFEIGCQITDMPQKMMRYFVSINEADHAYARQFGCSLQLGIGAILRGLRGRPVGPLVKWFDVWRDVRAIGHCDGFLLLTDDVSDVPQGLIGR